MSLQSPTAQSGQSLSRPSSTTSESEYLSEVFAGEMEEPVPSAALSSLIRSNSSPHPTPMTSRFSGKVNALKEKTKPLPSSHFYGLLQDMVRPTPVRPSSFSDRLPQVDSTDSSVQRRASLKVG